MQTGVLFHFSAIHGCRW